jgi:hypothetical protein
VGRQLSVNTCQVGATFTFAIKKIEINFKFTPISKLPNL